MTNKPISEVIRDMREHADYILELKEEYPNGHDDLIHAYDHADTLFGAENVKRLLDHIAALEQQLAETKLAFKVRCDLHDATKQQLAAERARVVKLPDLNADLVDILGRPNFHCSPVAQCLRVGGAEIPRKSENEQAACIHWMLSLYLQHGEKWRTVAQDELKRIAAGIPVEGE